MFTYKISKGMDEFEDARTIRTKVFVQEQGFIEEFDDIDAKAYHIVVYDGNKPVATGRTFPNGEDTYSIGRIAVLKEYRKKKLGKFVVETLEEKLRELNAVYAKLSAQCQAQGFYEKLGYQCEGEKYYEEHCAHIKMCKKLIQ